MKSEMKSESDEKGFYNKSITTLFTTNNQIIPSPSTIECVLKINGTEYIKKKQFIYYDKQCMENFLIKLEAFSMSSGNHENIYGHIKLLFKQKLKKMEKESCFTLERFGELCGWFFCSISSVAAVISALFLKELLLDALLSNHGYNKFGRFCIFLTAFIYSLAIAYISRQLILGIHDRNPKKVEKFLKITGSQFCLLLLFQFFLIFDHEKRLSALLLLPLLIYILIIYFIAALKKKLEKERPTEASAPSDGLTFVSLA
ncbi:CLUMA_CG016564, isoform A [Clunio marinus]|uniref:CLUMA_CG016564, isoform A n=1 Tax=Clunio marinus TaxID=568069 RepID=A0A1J1ISJ7_9DIPT|nr:CLUMA_CG016564, isoform A [Clunio marinus]